MLGSSDHVDATHRHAVAKQILERRARHKAERAERAERAARTEQAVAPAPASPAVTPAVTPAASPAASDDDSEAPAAAAAAAAAAADSPAQQRKAAVLSEFVRHVHATHVKSAFDNLSSVFGNDVKRTNAILQKHNLSLTQCVKRLVDLSASAATTTDDDATHADVRERVEALGASMARNISRIRQLYVTPFMFPGGSDGGGGGGAGGSGADDDILSPAPPSTTAPSLWGTVQSATDERHEMSEYARTLEDLGKSYTPEQEFIQCEMMYSPCVVVSAEAHDSFVAPPPRAKGGIASHSFERKRAEDGEGCWNAKCVRCGKTKRELGAVRKSELVDLFVLWVTDMTDAKKVDTRRLWTEVCAQKFSHGKQKVFPVTRIGKEVTVLVEFKNAWLVTHLDRMRAKRAAMQ